VGSKKKKKREREKEKKKRLTSWINNLAA